MAGSAVRVSRAIDDIRCCGELGSRSNEIGRAIGAAIVHDEHIDPSRQRSLGRGAQISDQLVQRRPEPGLFVVRGQNDAQASEDHERECIGALGSSSRRPTEPGRSKGRHIGTVTRATESE